MLKYIVAILFLICAITNNSLAQYNYTITIQAKEDAKPISLASVFCACGKLKNNYVANINGMVIINAATTNCKINITAIGYEPAYNMPVNADTIIYLDKKNAVISDIIITGQTSKILAQQSIYKVFTINNTAIKQQAANTLADVLNNETNFYKQQDNILGSSANLMGIGGQNIKILVNGAPINGRENGNIDVSQINVANAERIEIVKGPMSVLYGSDALGGVINIITNAGTTKPKLNVQLYSETINKINTGLDYSIAKKKHSIYINATRNFFGGYAFTDTFNRAQSWKPKVQYMAEANYSYTHKNYKLTYMPNFMWEHLVNKGTPIVDPFGATAIDEHYKTIRFNNTLLLDIETKHKNKITLSNSVSYYNRIRTKYISDLVLLDRKIINTAGSLDTSTFIDINARAFANKKYNHNLSLIYGYDINSQQANSLKLLNQKQSITDYALFLSAPFNIVKSIQLQPALRISYNTQYIVPMVPSINVRAELPRSIIARASYAQGFRAPSLKEMYLQFVDVNHNVIGNTFLKPEQSQHAQATFETTIINKNKTRIQLLSATYFNNIKNQIALAYVPNTTNTYQYTNIGRFKNVAQEFKATVVYKKLNTTLGTSINTILKTDSVAQFTNWELTAKANYLFTKFNTSLNCNYRYISRQPILAVATLGNGAFGNAYLPGQHFADVNVSQSCFKNKLELQIGVRNIFGITTLGVIGATSNGIHSQGNTQLIAPNRSVFLNVRYAIGNK
jgi:outer membrane receptor for ferrienterochelin and colicins